MKIANVFNLTAILSAVISSSLMTGCADWQTTPTTVDEYHGTAVRHMIANQTLYPEHSQQFRQDLILDGAKGESIIKGYRAPVTDLRQGKQTMQMDVGDSR